MQGLTSYTRGLTDRYEQKLVVDQTTGFHETRGSEFMKLWKQYSAAAFVSLIFIGCSGEPPQPSAAKAELFLEGARISGVNGIHFGPDGYLYATSVIGSDISVVDTTAKEIIKRYGPAEGVFGPDDVAFNAKGDFYWTSILTGEVAGFKSNGVRLVAANLGPGVNPITFSDDGRLFVAQCFFGDGLYEVDPLGEKEPRSIRDDLGPGCGLNGMDWGPDQRLYGPRWFNNEVVSLDVETGDTRVEASGLQVPAAVKFNSAGELHILDTGAGTVLKRDEDGSLVIVAKLQTGLDNFAFDDGDNLFVSSYADGSIVKVSGETLEEILPGGISHPGGLAVVDETLVVADLQSLRGVDIATTKDAWVLRNIFRSAPLGTTTAVANHGENLLLTSWLDNSVKMLDPKTGEIVQSIEGLGIPVSAIPFGEYYAVALHADSSVSLLNQDGSFHSVLSDDFDGPTHVISFEDGLLVSDTVRGQVVRVLANGETEIVVDGLASPEGLAVHDGVIYVFEGSTGKIKAVSEDQTSTIATLSAGSPAATSQQPPSMVFNGLVVHDGYLYAADEMKRSIYRIAI